MIDKNILTVFVFGLSCMFSIVTNGQTPVYKAPCLDKSYCDDTCQLYYNLGFNSSGQEEFVNVYMLPNIHFTLHKWELVKKSEAKNVALITLVILNDSCYVNNLEVVKYESAKTKKNVFKDLEKELKRTKFIIQQKDLSQIEPNKKYIFIIPIGLNRMK